MDLWGRTVADGITKAGTLVRISDHILKTKKQLPFNRPHILRTLHLIPAHTGPCLQNLNLLRTNHVQAIA